MRTTLATTIALLLCAVPGTNSRAADPSPVTGSGDDRHDMILIVGQRPGERAGSDQDGGGSSCPGCRFQTTPICTSDPAAGIPLGRLCGGLGPGCPGAGRWLAIWRGDAGGWVFDGITCSSDAPGVSIADIDAAVRDDAARRLPAPHPTRQPAGPAVLNVPMLFDAGQPAGDRTWTARVLGFSVTVVVHPRWEWHFGDGGALSTTRPGGSWPITDVAHTYRSPQRWRAGVTTTWTGTFTVAGFGTFPITGAVSQQAGLTAVVVPAGAVLVG